MSDRYLYLLLNVATISIPFLASFYKKAPFYKTWKRVLPALLFPLILFIVWDVWFTRLGVWGFNPKYLSGVYLLNLPLEEWLFFITVPYACLFTYFAIKYFKRLPPSPKWLALTLGIITFFIGFIFHQQQYTFFTFFGLGLVFLIIYFAEWPYLYQFFLSYAVTLIPFFIINGVLTGSWIQDQVVWYNDLENFGIRLGTIPLEDAFYGMFLLMLNTLIWEGFNTQPK